VGTSARRFSVYRLRSESEMRTEAMSNKRHQNLVFAFSRKWDLRETLVFEKVYHKNLRLSLNDKKTTLKGAQCVWLYRSGTRELMGRVMAFRCGMLSRKMRKASRT
jgi:hypothetical protein